MRQTTRRLLLTTAALILVGLGAAGWAVWNSTSTAHGDRSDGRRIAVDVVAPHEPDLIPGPVLSVGDLRDGYEHDPERLEPPAPLDDPYLETPALESAWLEPEPAPTPNDPESLTLERRPPPRLEEGDYSFGFDAPEPDATQPAPVERPRPPRSRDDAIFY